MDLVIIRHAIAEDRDIFAQTGKDDSQRPLTERGQERMRRAAGGLHGLVPSFDVIATSPYTRANETADIVAAVYGGPDPVLVDALVPGGDRQAFLSWLTTKDSDSTGAAVGHEPDLGMLASWLLAASREHFVEFKKGAACLVHWDGKPSAGAGWLSWALTPGQLRKMRKAK